MIFKSFLHSTFEEINPNAVGIENESLIINLSSCINFERSINIANKLCRKTHVQDLDTIDDEIKNKKSILLLEFNPTQYKILLNELSKLDKNILLLIY